MCKNDQNDSYLDSLVDSYAASQDTVEKKLETFAQSRQISQRIARARLNEVDFNNKYHRSKKGEIEEEEPLITIVNFDEPEETEDRVENSLHEREEENQKAIKINQRQPDFIGTSTSDTLTKSLSNLNDLKVESDSSLPLANTKPLLPEEDLKEEKEESLTIEFNPTNSSPSNPTKGYASKSVSSEVNPQTESTKAIPTPLYDKGSYSQLNQGYSGSNPTPRNEGQSTRVFNTPNETPNPSSHNIGQTISMTPGSIPQSVQSPNLDRAEGVKLKRQYVNSEGKDVRSEEERRPHHASTSRIYLTIAAITASLVLLIVGGIFVKNYIEDTFHVTQNSSAYDELMAWALDYPTYTEKQQKTITQWRVTFEKCTTEQKDKINDVLVSGTGKTFDELLATAVASQNKETSISNENVAKAEKKAKLKDEISVVQGEINNLQNQLNGINGRIMAAEANYNNKNAAYMAAQNKVQSCQNALDTLNIQLNSLPNEASLQSQLSALKAQLSTMNPTIVVGGNSDSQDDESLASPPIGVPGTPNGTNSNSGSNNSTSMSPNEDLILNHPVGLASDEELNYGRHHETSGTIVPNPDYQALQQEISDLEDQIQTASSERFSLQVQISEAETALSEAQEAVPEAKSEADAAYGAWQALKNEADPIQKQIDEKNMQLAQLQDELNSIQ